MMSLVIGMAIIAIIGAGIIGMVAKNSEFAVASSGVQETEKISDVARKWYNRDADSDGVPDGAWPTVAQIQGSYYPGWDGNNPWGNAYNLTVSSEGILTITQTVPAKFTAMYTNRLSMSSASGNVITYHVPPPGSYTENVGFVHRTGDTMDSGAEIEFAGAGGKITGLRTSDIGDPMDAVNVEWYDTDVEERFEQLVGQIEDGSIVAGHAAWADNAQHANLADRSLRADWADTTDYALNALYANTAGSTNYANSAGTANTAGRADRATRADRADRADYADRAGEVDNPPNNPQPTGTPGGGGTWSLVGGPNICTLTNSTTRTLRFNVNRTTSSGGNWDFTETLAPGGGKTWTVSDEGTGSICHLRNYTYKVTCTTSGYTGTKTGVASYRTCREEN